MGDRPHRARSLVSGALVVAAAGFLAPVLWSGTTAMVIGVSVAAAGLGALFVDAAATALSSVAHHQATRGNAPAARGERSAHDGEWIWSAAGYLVAAF